MAQGVQISTPPLKFKRLITIENFSANIPEITNIELNDEQFRSLWYALENPYKEALNAEQIRARYFINMYGGIK